MSVSNIANSNLPKPHLTNNGFNKLPLIGENKHHEKVRLYHLDPQSDKVETAKAALLRAVDTKSGEFKNSWDTFVNDLQKAPYLLKEGKTFKLVSSEEAIKLQLKYGVIGEKAAEKSTDVLKLLQENKITTDEEFVKFYNQAEQDVKEALLPLINTMFFIFSNERTVLDIGEVKTLTLLGQCNHEGIQTGALTLLMQLFEESHFMNKHYGFGLKFLIDGMPEAFFQKNQLLLLNIFDKLIDKFVAAPQTAKSVNHEIEPLMASLVSVGRALLNSDLEKLHKETKKAFYQKLKGLYMSENYSRRIQALTKDTNYLLIHSCLWTLQHLVRITSNEHKVVTTVRKTFYGLVTIKTLAGAPLKAAAELFHNGKLPDETLIQELQKAYVSGKKAFGIKDLPRLWYELLEQIETSLINPQLSVEILEKIDDSLPYYITEQSRIRTLLTQQKIIDLPEDTEEFVFGFVKQLSEVAIDHQDSKVRQKALEILERIFNKYEYKNIQLLILTTLKNLIDENIPVTVEQGQALQVQLLQAKPDLAQEVLFRQSKYPCLALLPGNSKLLDTAKSKLQAVAHGTQTFPMSKFIYGYRDIKVFEKKVTIGGNFSPKGPESISAEELQRVIGAAEKLHIVAFDRNVGNVTVITRIGNLKKTVFKEEVVIAKDYNQ
jgi:hypothetical protein